MSLKKEVAELVAVARCFPAARDDPLQWLLTESKKWADSVIAKKGEETSFGRALSNGESAVYLAAFVGICAQGDDRLQPAVRAMEAYQRGWLASQRPEGFKTTITGLKQAKQALMTLVRTSPELSLLDDAELLEWLEEDARPACTSLLLAMKAEAHDAVRLALELRTDARELSDLTRNGCVRQSRKRRRRGKTAGGLARLLPLRARLSLLRTLGSSPSV